jgi:hypothetical protein
MHGFFPEGKAHKSALLLVESIDHEGLLELSYTPTDHW